MDYAELAQQFLHNMHRFRSQHHQKQVNQTMHGEAFAVLYIFEQGGIVLPSDISNEMNISSARVAAMLNNLESKGLITRRIDTADRRRVLVDLTAEGIELAKQRRQMVMQITTHMMEWLGADDAQQLVRIVGRLAEYPPLDPCDK